MNTGHFSSVSTLRLHGMLECIFVSLAEMRYTGRFVGKIIIVHLYVTRKEQRERTHVAVNVIRRTSGPDFGDLGVQVPIQQMLATLRIR
jgi:hypothetical protein